jgi:hypothetical protein
MTDLLIFVLLQALMINGIYYCFQGGCTNDLMKGTICSGNIFYKIAPKFFERNKNKTWSTPLLGCVKCMASTYGTLSFWFFVLYVYGFAPIEIGAWIMDVFVLVSVNWIIYKML